MNVHNTLFKSELQLYIVQSCVHLCNKVWAWRGAFQLQIYMYNNICTQLNAVKRIVSSGVKREMWVCQGKNNT